MNQSKLLAKLKENAKQNNISIEKDRNKVRYD